MYTTRLRTHTCGELKKADIKKKVKLSGWNHSGRDHGGIIFIDLRDRYGLTQIVFDPSHNKKAHAVAESLRREDVLQVEGHVRTRGEGLENLKLATGKIEVLVDTVEILNSSETPPIEVDDNKIATDDVRLKYRYVDLRRPLMQKHLTIRHKAMLAAMKYFDRNGFRHLETPMLVRATPEGARDYVVPSRVNPGRFYALPQSPQLYKQILMVSGCDRYFQFARCLRDEDLRADRQPEHTQIDLEMSFVEKEDIFEIVEGLFKAIFKEAIGYDVKTPFPIFTYKESMAKYGTDKPDTRFDLFLYDVTDISAKSDFGVFKNIIENGGIVKCINPKKEFSRNDVDKYEDFVTKDGAKGMVWMKVTEEGLESNVAKLFSKKLQQDLIKKTGAKPGSFLFFIAGKQKKTNAILANLRLKLGEDLELYDKKQFRFSWVTDFPLFSWNEAEDRWEPEHHVFSHPKKEHLKYLETDPGKILGDLYDLALNGSELCSGSIRINRPEIQERVFNVIGLPKEKAYEKFGFLLEAFKYGAPPHGGVGLGFDRIVGLMCGYYDIREVIAFPKNKNAECPMDGSPGLLYPEQIKELQIKLDLKKKK